MAARSEERVHNAMDGIRTAHPDSKGKLVFLHLDLGDLTTIKATAEKFLAAETQLNVLWLNAGVMIPPWGSRTAQGYELQLGTNNLGHFLLARYLHLVLRKTAKTAPKDSVRVVWVSSGAALLAPSPPIDFDNMDFHKEETAWTIYGRSKAGNVLHANEFARRFKGDGIISVVRMHNILQHARMLMTRQSLHPGNLKSNLQKHMNWIESFLTVRSPTAGQTSMSRMIQVC